jgi:hypothetical protein
MGTTLGVTVDSTVLGSIILGIAVVVGVPVMVRDWRKARALRDTEVPPAASGPWAMIRPHAPSRSGRSIARRTVLQEALIVAIVAAVGVAVILGGNTKGGDGGN